MMNLRKLRHLLCAGLMAIFVTSPAQVRADIIELRADIWCPFNCEPDSDSPGYMVELAREALALYGHEVRYSTMTWSRSLDWARRGEINGVIGTDEEESPELVFGEPIGVYQEALIFRKGEARTIETVEDMDGLRVGAVVDYDYNDVFETYIHNNEDDPNRVQIIGGDDSLKRNLMKLKAKRIDMALDEGSVVAYTIEQMGLKGQLDVLPYGELWDLYIAFSPAIESSQLYAQQLSEGVNRLKDSGRYTEILRKYGLAG